MRQTYSASSMGPPTEGFLMAPQPWVDIKVDGNQQGMGGEKPGGRLSRGGPGGWCCPNQAHMCAQKLTSKLPQVTWKGIWREVDGTGPGGG